LPSWRTLFPFLKERGQDPKAEFYIPSAIGDLLQAGEVRIKVLSTADRWVGMTYQQDKAAAITHLHNLVVKGVYPKSLWGENGKP